MADSLVRLAQNVSETKFDLVAARQEAFATSMRERS
jgi:hypothetical protein